MATATIAPPKVVVAFPQPAEGISQSELQLLLSLRNRAEQLEAQITEAEQNIKARLQAGAPVEAGLIRAFLKTTERRNVSWKSIVERECGEDYARRVLAATKPDTYTNLVVTA